MILKLMVKQNVNLKRKDVKKLHSMIVYDYRTAPNTIELKQHRCSPMLLLYFKIFFLLSSTVL